MDTLDDVDIDDDVDTELEVDTQKRKGKLLFKEFQICTNRVKDTGLSNACEAKRNRERLV